MTPRRPTLPRHRHPSSLRNPGRNLRRTRAYKFTNSSTISPWTMYAGASSQRKKLPRNGMSRSPHSTTAPASPKHRRLPVLPRPNAGVLPLRETSHLRSVKSMRAAPKLRRRQSGMCHRNCSQSVSMGHRGLPSQQLPLFQGLQLTRAWFK